MIYILRILFFYFIFVKDKQNVRLSLLILKCFYKMKDRIKQLMDQQQMTQQEFAKFLDISPASLSNIFGGRTKPTLNIIEAIKQKIPDINLDWLMFGSGEMLVDATFPNRTSSESQATEESIAFSDTPESSSPTLLEQPKTQCVQNTPKKQQQIILKEIDKYQRHVSSITVFYDDGTFDTFGPKT